MAPGGSYVPPSQAMCSSLLEECFEIAQEIRAQEDTKNVSHELQPIHDRLSQIRAELENLVLTHRWTLRETDLWNYSLSLQEIDKMRVEGKFVDSEGNRPGGQYVRFSFDNSKSMDNVDKPVMSGFDVSLTAMLWPTLSVIIFQ